MDNKTLFYSFNHRDQMTEQTLCQATNFAGKMRVTLSSAAVVGKFEMPCSVLHVNFVHQTNPAQTLKRTVNGNLVKTIFPQSAGNPVLAEWFVRIDKDLQHS